MADLLIVDDDLDVAELLAEALVLRGHVVRIARDGEDGLRELEIKLPDLVLLDVEMPVLDGPGMVTQMRARADFDRVPILLLSGIVGLDRVAARVGTPYFLNKPYPLPTLLLLCERAIAEREAPRPARR
jgi:DNA-binding response OmpR family regulator